jgi:hypothetical protein
MDSERPIGLQRTARGQRWKRFPVGPLRDHATQLACPFTISRQTKPFEKWVFSNGDFL